LLAEVQAAVNPQRLQTLAAVAVQAVTDHQRVLLLQQDRR
jgi:hypothetical protein